MSCADILLDIEAENGRLDTEAMLRGKPWSRRSHLDSSDESGARDARYTPLPSPPPTHTAPSFSEEAAPPPAGWQLRLPCRAGAAAARESRGVLQHAMKSSGKYSVHAACGTDEGDHAGGTQQPQRPDREDGARVRKADHVEARLEALVDTRA
eukprot:scaffold8896_cov67-Phaeocystis_antarctica.AAC.7